MLTMVGNVQASLWSETDKFHHDHRSDRYTVIVVSCPLLLQDLQSPSVTIPLAAVGAVVRGDVYRLPATALNLIFQNHADPLSLHRRLHPHLRRAHAAISPAGRSVQYQLRLRRTESFSSLVSSRFASSQSSDGRPSGPTKSRKESPA